MPVLPIARLSRADLADLNSFLVVEAHRSFTKAAVELGVTTSALSHAIRNLEERLGVRLLNRTNRTVSPTAAGTTLAKRLAIGFQEIGGALAEVDQHRDRPSGRLRINVLSDGARLLFTKHLPAYLDAYPDVSVEIAIDDRMVDIVAAGFDAGVRYGETIPEDFIAVAISDRIRWVAAASPRYINRSPRLEIPEDLLNHKCIQIRTGQGTIYRWDFEKEGDHRVIDVPGQLCVNETEFGIQMALADRGITYCPEERIRAYLDTGRLQVVLSDWAPIEPPYYLYYPGRRQMPPGLRELINMMRARIVA
ncbi:putative transcriptional regulator [Pseudomonas sp. JV551A1]|uniref:LysR family transcriptional regulator n=1 Tax=Pseudomonas sp. JV551A1 TaxID=2078787 RepID=UPI00100C6CB8|nr:LysR family transcriptional regulator [Pseudomonas sp. JV551A1]SPO55724.1 putative transcriptional regulator [Pseudomonas sp. JV551A1]